MLFSPLLSQQLLFAVMLASTRQLTGINAVFFYSSDIFSRAGVADDRVGTLIVNTVNIIPTIFVGPLSAWFGNRYILLGGVIGMFVSALGMTGSLVFGAQALSIIFTVTYVAAFEFSLGPLPWVVIADLFPHDARATGSAMCTACNWLCNLIVGVGYPYVAAVLDNYGFSPFVVILAMTYAFVLWKVPETAGKTMEEVQQSFQRL